LVNRRDITGRKLESILAAQDFAVDTTKRAYSFLPDFYLVFEKAASLKKAAKAGK